MEINRPESVHSDRVSVAAPQSNWFKNLAILACCVYVGIFAAAMFYLSNLTVEGVNYLWKGISVAWATNVMLQGPIILLQFFSSKSLSSLAEHTPE